MDEKRDEERRGPSISIGGNVGGSVTVGDGNTVIGSVSQGGSVIISGGPVSQVFTSEQQALLSRMGSAEELNTLAERFQKLDQEIETHAPQPLQSEAKAQADRLKTDLVTAKPDLANLESANRWFADNTPLLLGAVTGVWSQPLAGKLVEASGETTAEQFRKRLGLSKSAQA